MLTYLDCYACLVRQALTASRLVNMDEAGQHRVMSRVLRELLEMKPGSPPPKTSWLIHTAIKDESGARDPYAVMKERSTREALALYPRLKELVASAADPFETAVRLSIAGNILDVAVTNPFDLEGSIQKVLSTPLAINDIPALQSAVQAAPWVLYLGDNAGETVFDRVFIEQMAPKPVTFVAKHIAVINDTTLEDAIAAGLDRAATLVTPGGGGMGILLEAASPEFRRLFAEAPVIISKGMANFETLNDQGSRLFFLLQVKCDAIGHDVGAPVGSLVVRRG